MSRKLVCISYNAGKLSNSISGGANIPVCRKCRTLPGRQECLPHRGEKCGLLSHAVLILLFLLVLIWPAWTLAGGGPENVLLVVNPRSPASLCIANHYAQLRQIPANNVFFVPWDPKADRTDIDTFRKQILVPILQSINRRRLGEQIDAVVYSSDFPWGITLGPDISKMMKNPEVDKVLADLKRMLPPQDDKGKPGAKKPAPKVEWSPLLGSMSRRSTG